MRIKIQSSKQVYNGFFRVDQIRLKHELFKGGWSSEIYRELLCQNQHGAVIFLYDLKDEVIVLIEQIRACTLATEGQNNWLLEPVAGMIEEGESAEITCVREAQEEAGAELSTKDLEFICEYYPSPGGFGEMLHLYAADIDSSLIGSHAGLADEDEDIKIHKISFKQAYQDLIDKKYNVASTYIALQWLFLHKANSYNKY
jgi:ADP-ribose pyrophosphatase